MAGNGKVVVNLATGLEDTERVTVASSSAARRSSRASRWPCS
jgi:hypothetical protein